MKRLAILTAAVLLVSLAICAGERLVVDPILKRAHALSTEVFVRMERGDVIAVREGLVELATIWDEHAGVLEVFCDHDDLHDVKQNIIQAEICMEYTDMEDFYASVALIGEGIEHIQDEEAASWTNFF